MPSTLANHDVVSQSSFTARARITNDGWWESQNVVVAGCTLTLTLPGSIHTATHLCSPFLLHSWGSASAHHLGLKRTQAQVLPHINPRLMAKGSLTQKLDPRASHSHLEARIPRVDSQSSCPDLRNPSLSRAVLLSLGRACANMGGPKSIRTAERHPLPIKRGHNMEPTTCRLWA